MQDRCIEYTPLLISLSLSILFCSVSDHAWGYFTPDTAPHTKDMRVLSRAIRHLGGLTGSLDVRLLLSAKLSVAPYRRISCHVCTVLSSEHSLVVKQTTDVMQSASRASSEVVRVLVLVV